MRTILLSLFLLGGCALPSSFDSTLYEHMVVIATDSSLAQDKCGTAAMPSVVAALNRESKLALMYSTYTAKDTHAAIEIVDKAIEEMNDIYKRGTPSYGYCIAKLDVIGLDAEIVLTGLGGKAK